MEGSQTFRRDEGVSQTQRPQKVAIPDNRLFLKKSSCGKKWLGHPWLFARDAFGD